MELLTGGNERLEGLASTPGTLEWDEMKKNAEAASTNEQGGLECLPSTNSIGRQKSSYPASVPPCWP